MLIATRGKILGTNSLADGVQISKKGATAAAIDRPSKQKPSRVWLLIHCLTQQTTHLAYQIEREIDSLLDA
jgi:hypothetical protein